MVFMAGKKTVASIFFLEKVQCQIFFMYVGNICVCAVLSVGDIFYGIKEVFLEFNFFLNSLLL